MSLSHDGMPMLAILVALPVAWWARNFLRLVGALLLAVACGFAAILMVLAAGALRGHDDFT